MRRIFPICCLLVLLMLTAAASAAQPDERMAAATNTPTATPSATATGTPTPAPSVSPTPSATPEPDAHEPNDTADQATPLAIGQRLDKLSFWPLGDVDYFSLVVKEGQRGMTLLLTTEHSFGLDTRMRLLTSDGQLIAENDDRSPTESTSHLAVVIREAGRYVVEVTNHAESRPDFKTYSLVTAWQHQQPTATPTMTPTSTATPTGTPRPDATPGPSTTPTPTATPTPPPWDGAEPNNSWEQANAIAIGEAVQKLNFVCPDASGCVDNDFFQVQLKAGICYRITTSDLQPGIDTNLIVYGPGKDEAPPLAGNDDATPGAFASAVEVCVPHGVGTLMGYLLVGNSGNQRPPEPAHTRTYTLRVEVVPPATPTPVPTREPTAVPRAAPTSAPRPEPAPPAGGTTPPAPRPTSAPTSAPRPDPTSAPTTGALPGVIVTELPPASEPQTVHAPQIAVSLSLRACYDRNANDSCDVDEGIGGLTVYVSDGDRGTLLGQALTDTSGIAQLTVRAPEDAQLSVSVPYFAATQQTPAKAPRLEPVILDARAALPALLP